MKYSCFGQGNDGTCTLEALFNLTPYTSKVMIKLAFNRIFNGKLFSFSWTPPYIKLEYDVKMCDIKVFIAIVNCNYCSSNRNVVNNNVK